jgi:hypothetical protein
VFDLNVQDKWRLIKGMKAYPLKFRQCIVDAVDQQYDTIEEIAALFGVI